MQVLCKRRTAETKVFHLPIRNMLYSLLGKKVGMTQVYDGANNLVPVTVIEAGPCSVVQVKTTETDGYNAIQIGFQKRRKSRLIKSQEGHFSKAGVEPAHFLKEFRCGDTPKFSVGDVLNVSGFDLGQKVDVIGTTKGRGFQGVVRRYNFSGGPASHGSMTHRRGGSYGQCQWPGEVDKGRKMPGQMGSARRTVQNLTVVQVLKDKNIILVKGSIPGANGSQVIVRTAKKQKKSA